MVKISFWFLYVEFRFILVRVLFWKWLSINSLFCCWLLVVAESYSVEEILCDLQFLLRSKDHSTYGYFLLLLCCSSPYHFGSWSLCTNLGSCLHSFNYYHFELSGNSKVCSFFPFFFLYKTKIHLPLCVLIITIILGMENAGQFTFCSTGSFSKM